ncbi:MFS polyamine transporter [Cylindrobasidium torrendii FP15055 ss-10]|uniref:MFS polyamine transporter n=1 Tax=Cylindrobasidium torrendii FP15055 ss-10 TaxID=1314674 RepID=A0A0D7BE79_9AGAR|nr:MFS polyamine transporter [Cylindrobasidium torrendii FP15055 ss-10]
MSSHARGPVPANDIDERLPEGSTPVEGLVIKGLDEAKTDGIDPRASLDLKGADKEATAGDEETGQGPLYVEFGQNDPRDPMQFSYARKWAITILSSYATLLASMTATAYSMGYQTMCTDLGCTDFRATVGLSLYQLGFGVVPLVTSSFSEEVGRQPLYFVSAGGFLLMFLLIALAPNSAAVLVGRFLQGGFGSTWATLVSGTIADIWAPKDRGMPMALFAVAAIGGSAVGPLMGGWTEMNGKLGWKWIEWIMMIMTALYLVLLPFVLKETRSSVLLRRLAVKIRKETGDARYRARIEDEHVKLRTLIWISTTRPLYLLFTEPIVSSFSLWISFAWGVMFALLESVPIIFKELYNFNSGQLGTVFVAILVATILGYLTNFYQERMYRTNFPIRGAESRLYGACAAAILLPVGTFIYAWTSFSYVHWIAPIIGIVLLMWAVFVIYLAVFTYLADAYGPFASSALAGQSLCRNMAAMSFPLFTRQMYKALGYHWASTLFACIATLLIPIPYVLFFFGPKIREHSKFSRQVLAVQQRTLVADDTPTTTTEKR